MTYRELSWSAHCLAGYGIAQVLELGVDAHLSSGQLVILFPDWEEERFPLYAYYPSRQYLAPKTRAFLEFLATTGPGLALAQNNYRLNFETEPRLPVSRLLLQFQSGQRRNRNSDVRKER